MSGYTNAALDLAGIMQEVAERKRFKLAAARVQDGILAAQRGELQRIGKTGWVKRQLSDVAVMNAVDNEGREVLKAAGESYWKDQDRREFGINADALRSPRAMRNRLGKVSWRKVY